MSRLYDHLAEIVETANGGFSMTRKGRRYFNRFLRQHGLALAGIKTHAALIDILGQCNAADFAAARERMFGASPGEGPGPLGRPEPESLHRLVA